MLLPGTEYPMEMTLEHALPQIIRAIVKRRRVAYIDLRWGLLAAWKMIPDCLWVKAKIKVSEPDLPLPDRAAIYDS